MRTRDLVVLGWCCEQYAARTDQLEVLLGCGPRTVQRALARLRDAGLVRRPAAAGRRAGVGDPDQRGAARGGPGVRGVAARIGLLAHVAAVNDVRLHVQAPLAGERMGP